MNGLCLLFYAFSSIVIPGLDPGIGFDWALSFSCWLIPGSSPGMTNMKKAVQLPPPSLTLPLKGGEDCNELVVPSCLPSPSPLEGEGRGGGNCAQLTDVGVFA